MLVKLPEWDGLMRALLTSPIFFAEIGLQKLGAPGRDASLTKRDLNRLDRPSFVSSLGRPFLLASTRFLRRSGKRDQRGNGAVVGAEEPLCDLLHLLCGDTINILAR